MSTKQEIRYDIRQQITGLDPTIRSDWDIRTSRLVLKSPFWQNAKTILLFASLPDEIETSLLIREAGISGKRIVLPMVRNNELALFFYHPRQLAPGAFGIMEPTPDAEPLTDFSMLDLALTPGIAFTRTGNRLGRGKGFYDRLLPHLSCPCFGLGYPLQVLDSLPSDSWDVSLDGIFSI